jgi:hypothetical protein
MKWTILLLITFSAYSADDVMKFFEGKMKNENSSFVKFSEIEGEKLFRTERVNSKGEKVSCMTCHTNDPKAEGKTRVSKVIDPLAPIANRERFTDLAKVEKWFKRNCKDVYDRECTTLEKGNFIKYMFSIK